MTTKYRVKPAEYLTEWMEDNKLDRSETAKLLNWNPTLMDLFIVGRVRLTPSHAANLERVTAIPQRAWLKYEEMYRTGKVSS